jgi:hypothetical protein
LIAYGLSGFKPERFQIESTSVTLNMRLPRSAAWDRE